MKVEMNEEPAAKKHKIEDSSMDDVMLRDFIRWMGDEDIELSQKVKISKHGSCARFGAIAVEDIISGDVLFTIPRKSTLCERNCSISSALSNYESNDSSGWTKLILCLMYEYTSPTSRWKPYMKFVPQPTCMDQPMFWSREEQAALLKGTGLDAATESDENKIANEYKEAALPFIKQHSSLGFDANIHTLQLYRHMVAFVMGYSFTEPNEGDEINPPMMVPMADALNHLAKNNAQLEFGDDVLIMRAIKSIPTGHEIYNTYGQLSNSQLLQMYGFVEEFPNNVYDCVDIELASLLDAAEDILPCVKDKRRWLEEERNLSGDYLIAFGAEGALSVSELRLLIRILPMTKQEMNDFQRDDGWSSDESDDETGSEFEVIAYKKMKNLDSNVKKCLRIAANSTLRRFKSLLVNETSYISASKAVIDVEDLGALHQWREVRCRALVEGHQQLLRLLIDSVADR